MLIAKYKMTINLSERKGDIAARSSVFAEGVTDVIGRIKLPKSCLFKISYTSATDGIESFFLLQLKVMNNSTITRRGTTMLLDSKLLKKSNVGF